MYANDLGVIDRSCLDNSVCRCGSLESSSCYSACTRAIL